MNLAVRIEAIPVERKHVLRRLLQLYIYDFTEFEPWDLDADGEFPYRYLDAYWAPEPGEERHPFFILDGDKLAGFALVRVVNGSAVMSEFFVMRPHRRNGVGGTAAELVIRTFPGSWIIHEHPANNPAKTFWHGVADAITGGNFDEQTGEDGAVTQRFSI
ncbi:MAG: GNAT family N-acetyltransferase [bacterium]